MNSGSSFPVLNLHPEPADRILDIAGLLSVLVLWSYVLMQYRSLPSTIPIHFNFHNEPDNYGSKMTLFILPVIASIIYFSFGFLIRKPHKLNHAVKITAENAERQYKLSTRLLRYMRFAIPFSFILLCFEIFRLVHGENDDRLDFAFPVTMVLIIGAIPVYVYYARKNQ